MAECGPLTRWWWTSLTWHPRLCAGWSNGMIGYCGRRATAYQISGVEPEGGTMKSFGALRATSNRFSPDRAWLFSLHIMKFLTTELGSGATGGSRYSFSWLNALLPEQAEYRPAGWRLITLFLITRCWILWRLLFINTSWTYNGLSLQGVWILRASGRMRALKTGVCASISS
jgi:hypothetical protein